MPTWIIDDEMILRTIREIEPCADRIVNKKLLKNGKLSVYWKLEGR